MAANGRVAPISAAGNPATTVPKFGKASRSTDSQVVPLKFSPMPSYEIDQLEHAHRPRSKNGVTLAVPIGTVADDSSPVQPRAHFHQPWWKSSIIKLMGRCPDASSHSRLCLTRSYRRFLPCGYRLPEHSCCCCHDSH